MTYYHTAWHYRLLQITLVLPHPQTLLSARVILPLGFKNADNLLRKSCLRLQLELQGTYVPMRARVPMSLAYPYAQGPWPTSPAAASLRVRSSVKSRLPSPSPNPGHGLASLDVDNAIGDPMA